ncbi:hypothetical protein ACFE04_010901 [Oxalis oulophora]
MDSEQQFRYGFPGVGHPFSYSQSTITPLPKRVFRSLNFDPRNLPNSPISSQFDSEMASTTNSFQETEISSENLSRASRSHNSSLESNSYFSQLSTPTSIQHTLQELESVLMGGDEEEVSMPNTSFGESSQPCLPGQISMSWKPQTPVASSYGQFSQGVGKENHRKSTPQSSVQGNPAGNLKQLLIACAAAFSQNNMDYFDKLIEQARRVVSVSGEPIQRLGAYMIEGLVARKGASGSNIYRALRCREPEGKDLLSYMRILYEICPYLKFGYMAANGAIAEACRNEERIHIVDFQIAQGTQWLTLLQALAARPGGPPHVRITGIDDPLNKYARGDGLEAVGRRLAEISKKFNIPVEFHGVPVFALDITRDLLDIRPGEALAVNFPLQLHHTPDESVDVNNPRDGLLRMIKSLSPKVVTLVEQESNTNTTPFLTRFIEALEYYLAMFESIDVTLPRDRKERINVEQHCLARDIVNIIACEGRQRVERHELLGKWKSRFMMAGFEQFPLSSYVNNVIRTLLRCYSEHYTLVEKEGAMLLGWKERNLISASAWH